MIARISHYSEGVKSAETIVERIAGGGLEVTYQTEEAAYVYLYDRGADVWYTPDVEGEFVALPLGCPADREMRALHVALGLDGAV